MSLREFKQSLLARVDIVDVIERHVPLKRAGANFTACCPFHSEKTPSFTVSQAKQFYHCFGCQANGTAIDFLMEYSGLGFREAVQELADLVGMQVPEERSEPRAAPTAPADAPLESQYQALAQAAQYFRSQLKQSTKAIAYLKSRGVSGEVAARFGLGYAPQGWQALHSVFPDYASPVLATCGLVIDGAEDRRYDRFRDRVMFPIQDGKGQVIGFGGRVLGEGEPKYLNSPETPLFEKGRELYGLPQARRAIRDTGMVVVVEGYMDVVALAQHGVENVVATLGTATTGTHVQKLLRMAERVVFCFDGDRAGRAAAWRALENSLSQLLDRKQVGFLFLPEEHDPDTWVREFGRDAFVALLADALPLSEFLLRELKVGVNLRSGEGRAQLVEKARPLVAALRAPVLSLVLRKEIAREAGLTSAEIDRTYGLRPELRAKFAQAPARTARRVPGLARQLLKCLVAEPALAREPGIAVPDEASSEADLLGEVIALVRSLPEAPTAGALFEAFPEGGERALLVALRGEILADWGEEFDLAAEFLGITQRLAEAERDRQWEQLQRKLRRGDQLTSEERALYTGLAAGQR